MTIFTQYSLLSFPSVHNQFRLLKIEAKRFPRTFIFTREERTDKYLISVEESLTPVIEKKMSMKNLAEKVISELILSVIRESNKLLEGEAPFATICILLPSSESPCIWLEDKFIKGELSFYIG